VALAELLINDQQDLMHKPVGWILREVGNRDKQAELDFLTRHYQQMTRTMLRYAIEKFPEPQRQAFMHNKVAIN
jgi:3-methyladenine DNA glycosylase AlkD